MCMRHTVSSMELWSEGISKKMLKISLWQKNTTQTSACPSDTYIDDVSIFGVKKENKWQTKRKKHLQKKRDSSERVNESWSTMTLFISQRRQAKFMCTLYRHSVSHVSFRSFARSCSLSLLNITKFANTLCHKRYHGKKAGLHVGMISTYSPPHANTFINMTTTLMLIFNI